MKRADFVKPGADGVGLCATCRHGFVVVRMITVDVPTVVNDEPWLESTQDAKPTSKDEASVRCASPMMQGVRGYFGSVFWCDCREAKEPPHA